VLFRSEMKAIAKDAHIPFDRWSCSLLYSMWKKKEPSASSSTHISVETCTEIQSIWSHDFMLTLEKFYQTGILHVTTEISGRPILLFLEYFGIVYSPDKVTYESYDAYLRMKVWTDYLSKKSDLASYLIQQMTNVSTNSDNNVQLFVTTKDPAEGTVGTVHYVQDQPCHVFDYDGFTTTNSTTLEDGKTTPSCALIYNLFNEEPTTEGTINNNACFFKMIREDFSQFMENSTPGAQVTFEVVEVSLKTTILTLSIGPRAVLTLIPAVIEKTQELEEKTNLATDPLEDSPHFIADDSNIPTAPIIAEKPKSSYLQAPSSSNEEHSEQYVDEDFFYSPFCNADFKLMDKESFPCTVQWFSYWLDACTQNILFPIIATKEEEAPTNRFNPEDTTLRTLALDRASSNNSKRRTKKTREI